MNKITLNQLDESLFISKSKHDKKMLCDLSNLGYYLVGDLAIELLSKSKNTNIVWERTESIMEYVVSPLIYQGTKSLLTNYLLASGYQLIDSDHEFVHEFRVDHLIIRITENWDYELTKKSESKISGINLINECGLFILIFNEYCLDPLESSKSKLIQLLFLINVSGVVTTLERRLMAYNYEDSCQVLLDNLITQLNSSYGKIPLSRVYSPINK